MIAGQESDDARRPTNNTNTNCDTGDSVYVLLEFTQFT